MLLALARVKNHLFTETLSDLNDGGQPAPHGRMLVSGAAPRTYLCSPLGQELSGQGLVFCVSHTVIPQINLAGTQSKNEWLPSM